MYKRIQLFLIIVFFSSTLYAQDWNEIYYLEGEAQYLIEEKKFEKAIDLYRRMIKEVPDNTYAKYMIGKLYLQTDDKKLLSIEYFEEASQNIALDFDAKSLREIRTPADALLYLGQAYQLANRIDEAIIVYNNFKDLITPEHEKFQTATQRLKTCENAKTALTNPLRVYSENLGEPLNDDQSNFGAAFSGDGQSLVYTSYTRNYLDNYYSKKENGTWSSPKKISEKISTKYYLKTTGLSHDGTELYLVTDDPAENDIFVCYKDGKNWTEANKLPKNINGKKSNETHAAISKDGKTLYFTSDIKGGHGGLDIYKSTRNAKGKWGDPVNLGPNVNTPFNEETPCIAIDDKYLFFSSEGHNSIGGFDIFYVDLGSNSTPVNLGYPINTPGNNLFFVPDNSLSSGWISRYDSTSVGKNDIYHISIMPKINFAGNIKNVNNNEIINDPEIFISFIDRKTNEIIKSAHPVNGEFEFEIIPGNYHIVINNDKYDTYTNKIDIPENYANSEFSFDALLNPISIEQEELVAKVVDEPENVSPPTEELAEEKPEPELIPEKEVVKEKVPEKEIIKYIPKTTISSGEKTYSVQLMALKNPVDVDYFKNVDNVKLTKYPDGFYRYTVGITSSYTEAQKIKENIHKIGYKDAFIRVNEFAPKYTIQIMALIIPVELNYFKDLSSVVVTKGADDYFRYTIGSFNTYDEAKQELTKLNSMGYNQAFIKKVFGSEKLAVN